MRLTKFEIYCIIINTDRMFHYRGLGERISSTMRSSMIIIINVFDLKRYNISCAITICNL